MKHIKCVVVIVVIVVGLFTIWSPATLAWGQKSHSFVASVAADRLTPHAMEEVSKLLAIDSAFSLAQVASWADDIRSTRKETAPWHYVNIPLGKSYNRKRDCPQDDCVVERIEIFQKVLANKKLPPGQRLEALKFLVHFVGDIHQPLHASDKGDRGGNSTLVRVPGRRKATNLHAVWDTAASGSMVKPEIGSNTFPSLVANYTVVWVNESARLAQSAYDLPEGKVPELTQSYIDKSEKVSASQLVKAGVRLAQVLNYTLR